MFYCFRVITDYSGPRPDERNELMLIAAKKQSNSQIIRFWKPRVGDGNNDFVLHNVHLIFPTKPGAWSERPLNIGQHRSDPVIGPKVFFNNCA